MFERLKKYDKKAIGQFIRFGIVGIINTLITLIVIYFLQEILHVKYTISNFIGYIAGVVNSFFWNKLWVFKKLNSNFNPRSHLIPHLFRDMLWHTIYIVTHFGRDIICTRFLGSTFEYDRIYTV